MNQTPGIYCRRALVSAAVAALCFTAACNKSPQPAAPSNGIVLEKLFPPSTPAGRGFNVQPDGSSAIAVSCRNATNKAVIVFGSQPLRTAFGSPTLLTATVPNELFATPGRIDVRIRDAAGESNVVQFVIR